MTQDLAAPLAALVARVPQGRAALLMDSDGMVVGSVGEDGAAAEALAGEFGMVLREAQGLAEARGWGSLRTFAVAGTHARVAFAAVPGGLVLALVGGPLALVGRLRRAVESAAPGFGAL